MTALDRFRDRAGDYARHRPTYPRELFADSSLRPRLAGVLTAADVGAGTGLFTRVLATVVPRVVAVEPEAAMVAEARDFLAGLPTCTVRQGRAEDTGLAEASVDLVTAAQAFHWFDREAFRRECRRILRPGGAVLIVRNRRDGEDPFMQDFQRSIPKHKVRPGVTLSADEIGAFFPRGAATCSVVWNEELDREAFLGRIRSNSTMPRPDHPAYSALVAEVDRLFLRWQSNGRVRYALRCQAWWGQP